MNKRVPSDDLHRVSELSLHWQPLFRLLEILPQFRLVIDTNAVLEELMFLVRSRKNPAARTNLQEAVDSGAVAAFAPSKLREEVARHIPRRAVERGIPEEALARAWRQYESRIKYVDVGLVSDARAGEVADPDDLPFVYLYREINADAVLTRDRHIRAMGARSIQLEALIHVREYARAKAPEVTLRAGAVVVTIPVAVVGHALWGLSKAAVRKLSGLPPWVQLALLGGVLAVGINPRSRRAVLNSVSPLVAKLKEPGAALTRVLGTLAEEFHRAQRDVDSRQRLLDDSIPRARMGPLKMVARSVCLQAGVLLTAEELTRGVLRAGYESRSSRLKYYLVRVLRQDEQFVCMPDGRWTVQLGEGGPKLNNGR
jgi:predicted nucleic acid-binding protein